MVGLIVLLLLAVFIVRNRAKRESGSNNQSPTTVLRANSQISNLDWIRADGKNLIDSSGRVVILRGFVTITNNTDGSEVSYTLDDYKHMKALGANYQSIRVGANALLDPGNSYLKRLDKMVSLAKQVGIYSEFKLTTYDLRQFRTLGPVRQNAWKSLWENTNSGQEKFIQGWGKLWQKYKDEPSVVGYDLLNEPETGSLKLPEDQFVKEYLNPFYQKIIDQLRTIDQKHLAIYQPLIGAKPYTANLNRQGIVFAPHYYPNAANYLKFGDLSTTDYNSIMTRLVSEASLNQAPLLLGEYGMPWSKSKDGDSSWQQKYQQVEQLASSLIDQYAVSSSRPHFADERACWSLDNKNYFCGSLILGKKGLNGHERKDTIDIFARPYPQRLAGKLGSFSYNFDSKQFSLQYTPDASNGQTEIYVPRTRHFANGFIIKHSNGITFVYDSSQSTSLKATQNTGNINANNFFWDETNQILTIKEWGSQPSVTLEISPK